MPRRWTTNERSEYWMTRNPFASVVRRLFFRSQHLRTKAHFPPFFPIDHFAVCMLSKVLSIFSSSSSSSLPLQRQILRSSLSLPSTASYSTMGETSSKVTRLLKQPHADRIHAGESHPSHSRVSFSCCSAASIWPLILLIQSWTKEPMYGRFSILFFYQTRCHWVKVSCRGLRLPLP